MEEAMEEDDDLDNLDSFRYIGGPRLCEEDDMAAASQERVGVYEAEIEASEKLMTTGIWGRVIQSEIEDEIDDALNIQPNKVNTALPNDANDSGQDSAGEEAEQSTDIRDEAKANETNIASLLPDLSDTFTLASTSNAISNNSLVGEIYSPFNTYNIRNTIK